MKSAINWSEFPRCWRTGYLLMLVQVAIFIGCDSPPPDGSLAAIDVPRCERLFLAVTAAIPPTAIHSGALPTPDSLAANPGIRLALQDYTRHYPDPAQGALVWVRYWSAQYQDEPITQAERVAAPLVLALLPAPPQADVVSLFDQHSALIFRYDPPLNQPDARLLALLFAENPTGLLAYLKPFGDFPEVPLNLTEQAIALWCAVLSDPDAGGPAFASRQPSPARLAQLQAEWVAATLVLLDNELASAAVGVELPDPRILSQALEPANTAQLQALFTAIPAGDARLLHPTVLATANLWAQGLLMRMGTADIEAARLLQERYAGLDLPADFTLTYDRLRTRLADINPDPSPDRSPDL